MTVTATTKDVGSRTLTVSAEFDAPADRVWRLWEDPRLLEQWWGPPTWPATFVEHELRPDGRTRYYMTGPDGTTAPGWWRIVSTDPPRGFEFENGFADQTGEPDPAMPVMLMRVAIADRDGGGTAMTVVVSFASDADMEQILTMGMAEGITGAMSQMDALL
jgi:uncharacterized protein YndB with AHSA1/START domain